MYYTACIRHDDDGITRSVRGITVGYFRFSSPCDTRYQYAAAELEVFKCLPAVRRIFVYSEFHRLGFAVRDKMHGGSSTRLVLHCTHVSYDSITAQLLRCYDTALRQKIEYAVVVDIIKLRH